MAAVPVVNTRSDTPKYLFDPAKGGKKATIFTVGTAKEAIVGILPILEQRSTFFAALDDRDVIADRKGEIIPILQDDPRFGVDLPVNLPFLFVWSHLNATIPGESTTQRKGHQGTFNDLSVEDVVRIWNYANYFGVPLHDDEFYAKWIATIRLVIPIHTLLFSSEHYESYTTILKALRLIKVSGDSQRSTTVTEHLDALIKRIELRYKDSFIDQIHGPRDSSIPHDMKEVTVNHAIKGDIVQIDTLMIAQSDVKTRTFDVFQKHQYMAKVPAGLILPSDVVMSLKWPWNPVHECTANVTTLESTKYYQSFSGEYWMIPGEMPVTMRFFTKSIWIPGSPLSIAESAIPNDCFVDVTYLQCDGTRCNASKGPPLPREWVVGSQRLGIYSKSLSSVILALLISGSNWDTHKDEIISTSNALRMGRGYRVTPINDHEIAEAQRIALEVYTSNVRWPQPYKKIE
jgi:hypothetical protein